MSDKIYISAKCKVRLFILFLNAEQVRPTVPSINRSGSQISPDCGGWGIKKFCLMHAYKFFSTNNFLTAKFCVGGGGNFYLGSCILHLLNVVLMSVPVTIESVGALKPDELFLEAVKVLKNKCRMILQQINNTNSQ